MSGNRADPNDIFAITGITFLPAWEALRNKWDELNFPSLVQNGTKQGANLRAANLIIPTLHSYFDGLPVLCKESEYLNFSNSAPGIEILPYKEREQDLPPNMLSVSCLNGHEFYEEKAFTLAGMSAGIIREGQPCIGMVMMLNDRQDIYCSNISPNNHEVECQGHLDRKPLKRCIIGVYDNPAVDPIFRDLVIKRLSCSTRTAGVISVPPVVGGICVLRGEIAAYVTSVACHEDVCGVAALCLNSGIVVRRLSGGLRLPWNQVNIPPMVFARDEATFQYVKEQAAEYYRGITL